MRWLFLGFIILAACTQVPEPTQPRVCCEALTAECLACDARMTTDEFCALNPETAGCTITVPYSGLFAYENLTSFTYQAFLGSETFNVTTTVSELTVLGTLVYILESSVLGSPNGNRLYVNAATDACGQAHAIVDGSLVEDECPSSGLNSQFADRVTLNVVKEETVTVIAGTYNVTHIEGDGVTYWVADGLPVPVAYASEEYAFQLVGYE